MDNDSDVNKLLTNLSKLICNYPRGIIFISVLLAIASLVFANFSLKFDTDQDNLISNSEAYHQRYKKFLTEFGDQEYIFVIFEVSKGEREKAKQALLSLVDKIKERKDLFFEISYQIDFSLLKNRFFFLVPDKDFFDAAQILDKATPTINHVSFFSSYADFIDLIVSELNKPIPDISTQSPLLENGFDLIKTIVNGFDNEKIISALNPLDLFSPLLGPGITGSADGFFSSDDGFLLFLQILPVKDYSTMNVVEEPLSYLRNKMDLVRKEFPNIPIGATGRPVLQCDEMISTGTDSIWASFGSFLGVLLLFIFFFKQGKRPIMSGFSLICGMSWSVGLITLTLGHLNLLTIVFAIILIGLGIDYGAHFLFRYQRERLSGKNVELAIDTTLNTTANAIVMGALTSSIAFLSALFTDFLGLKELGFVAGTGIILCLASQIVTFPAFLILFDKEIKNKKTLVPPSIPKRFDLLLSRPKLIIVLTIAITLLSCPLITRVSFENNLLKLQDPSLESVKWEKRIVESSKLSTWVAAILTPSRNKLKSMEKHLSKLKSVDTWNSINSIIPENQNQRSALLQDIRNKIIFPEAKDDHSKIDPKQLQTSLVKLQESFEHIEDLAFKNGRIEAVMQIDPLIEKIGSLLKELETNPENTLNKIQSSQNNFMNLVHRSFDLLKNNLSPTSLSIDDLPQEIRRRYMSPQGNYALYIYPNNDIWQPDFMEEFISDLRTIDPHVTGSPFQVYESAKRMKQGFYLVGWLTFILIFVLLYFELKSFQDTLITSLPLVVGLLWLVCFMGLFNINLSLGNFFALPILIGIGIDNGIHLIHHFRESNSVEETLRHITPAITLSTLTTTIGFGTLSLVHHKGLASFGQMMTIGSLTCLIASLLIVPAILKLGKN